MDIKSVDGWDVLCTRRRQQQRTTLEDVQHFILDGEQLFLREKTIAERWKHTYTHRPRLEKQGANARTPRHVLTSEQVADFKKKGTKVRG